MIYNSQFAVFFTGVPPHAAQCVGVSIPLTTIHYFLPAQPAGKPPHTYHDHDDQPHGDQRAVDQTGAEFVERFADGRVGMQQWRGKGLIDWNMQALHNPASFSFYRTPAANDEEEQEDFETALRAYPYKSLL